MTEEQKDYKNITSQAEIVEGKVSQIIDEPAGVPAVINPNVMDIMMEAVRNKESKETLETLKELYKFQKEIDADNARKAYHKSMAAFKANPPKIWRDMQVKYGTGEGAQEWSHADLGVAADAISRSLGEYGLNHTWRLEPQEDGKTKVTCVMAHELGHTEKTWLSSDPDKTGSKNAIQSIGSAIFYLERYTLFALSGLAPAHMDNDGELSGGKPEPEYITKGQVTIIDKLIKDSGANLKKVLGYSTDGKTIATIPAESFKEVKTNLETRLTWLKEQAEKKKAPPEREPGEEG